MTSFCFFLFFLPGFLAALSLRFWINIAGLRVTHWCCRGFQLSSYCGLGVWTFSWCDFGPRIYSRCGNGSWASQGLKAVGFCFRKFRRKCDLLCCVSIVGYLCGSLATKRRKHNIIQWGYLGLNKMSNVYIAQLLLRMTLFQNSHLVTTYKLNAFNIKYDYRTGMQLIHLSEVFTGNPFSWNTWNGETILEKHFMELKFSIFDNSLLALLEAPYMIHCKSVGNYR